jgi:hypothetical protein
VAQVKKKKVKSSKKRLDVKEEEVAIGVSILNGLE